METNDVYDYAFPMDQDVLLSWAVSNGSSAFVKHSA